MEAGSLDWENRLDFYQIHARPASTMSAADGDRRIVVTAQRICHHSPFPITISHIATYANHRCAPPPARDPDMLRRHFIIATAACALLLGAASGCSFDIEPGSQIAGQQCSSDDDCAQGLVCSDRICRHAAGSSPSISDTDVGDSEVGPGPDPEVGPEPVDVPIIDAGEECSLGDQRCASEETFQICQSDGQGGTMWSAARFCANDEVCDNGECVDACADGEVFNPVTEECVPDEDPEPCCPGGCADDQICYDCSCVDYQPETCQYQDQPCNAAGQLSGDFVCIDYDGLTEPRCMGFCDPGASDPDATCPGANSVCTYEEPTDPEGLCFTSCAIEDPCADDGMRCVYLDGTFDDGICYPSTGTGEAGDPCDPQDPFSCAGQALCMEGLCMQSCRPFDQGETDCDDGYCLPVGDGAIGICTEDVSDGQGGCTSEGGTCGEDAVACFPGEEPGAGLECHEFCRLEPGVDDCRDDEEVCHRVDQENEEIGICGPGFATQ